MARDTVNLDIKIDQFGMRDRYEDMLNNVANMLDKNGPIYTTWIYFQIGLDDTKHITFDSSSTDKQQNLIASLSIEKSCSGIANTFTLVIQYDPFNFGQDTSNDTVEMLDEFIAKAMAEVMGNSTSACRGRVQYGYNSTSTVSDAELVSPLYSFFLTNATSNVSFDSGITTYTFTGVSALSIDCDFVTEFEKVEDENLLEVVGRTLYRYYGDPNNPPNIKGISNITPESSDIRYNIDIKDIDIQNAVSISVDKTANTQSPWNYCKSLLENHPLTQEEENSEEFSDLSKISINKRPRYSMYLTDVDGKKTIHIAHVTPSSIIENGVEKIVEDNPLKINYVFSWGMKNENLQNKNIVTGWKPEVDLYTYLIRNANHNRFKKIEELHNQFPDNKYYAETYEKLAISFRSDIVEMYNAELELIGIPADPPMTAQIEVIPRILEKVSRTAGIYVITGASDEISNTGIFKSTLKLFRVGSRDLDTKSLTAKMNEIAQDTKLEKYYTSLDDYIWVTPAEKQKIEKTSYQRQIQSSDVEKLVETNKIIEENRQSVIDNLVKNGDIDQIEKVANAGIRIASKDEVANAKVYNKSWIDAVSSTVSSWISSWFK